MADVSKGFFPVLRCLIEHWVWKIKPFSKGQAWLDMLLLASYEAKQIYFEGKLISIQEGDFITSQFKLAERWGWSRQQVRSFLRLLEHPNPDLPMIICQNLTYKATKITILNYKDLQKTITSPTTSHQPADNQLLTTTNKYKKGKKEKNITYNHSSSNWEGILEEDKKAWQEAYPACDIDIELAKMREWVKGAGAKGHKSQWRKFITNWLSRNQDRGGTKTKEVSYGKGPESLRENQTERREKLSKPDREIT